MPATPNLFSDSKLIEAAVAFFADAESAVARTVDEVGDAMRDGEGWTSHSGVTFIQRPAVRGSQGALVEAILRKLGPRSGHEDEIRSTTWRGAAQWLTASERTPPEDAARLMLRTIGETADVTADLVIPNYTFRRAQGVSGARIGPVEILDSEIAKARVDALDNEHVRFAIDHGRGTSIRDSAVALFTSYWRRLDQEMVQRGLIRRPSGLEGVEFLGALHKVSAGVIGRVPRLTEAALEIACRRSADRIELYDFMVATERWALAQNFVESNPFRSMLK